MAISLSWTKQDSISDALAMEMLQFGSNQYPAKEKAMLPQ